MNKGRKRAVGALGLVAIATLSFISLCHATSDEPSVCFGSPKSGALRNGWLVPRTGTNFRAYSDAGWGLGRTYVHSSVHAIVLEAYAALAVSLPGRRFVYGETGFVCGGTFSPHRTHQNGLSVDFMVPVVDADGGPGELPTSAANKFGYDMEFDRDGKSGTLTIDFEALAAHLQALKLAAKAHSVPVERVIFAPDLQKHLHRTAAWPQIRDLPFSQRPSWVRHDDHYHVDFGVTCEPMDGTKKN